MTLHAKFIMTASGSRFDFMDPDGSEFTIEDIAHALSHICRFTGHTREFYSVAQHSVLVSRLVPPEHAYAALMHDAAEAFVGDMSTTLKALCPDYKAVEKRVERAVATRFGMTLPLHPCVKQADLVMLATEKRDLMRASAERWEVLEGIEPNAEKVKPWASWVARSTFLQRYRWLRAADERHAQVMEAYGNVTHGG